MSQSMDASEFDRTLVASAFALAGERGWARLSVAEAARRAGLPLDRARARFPGRLAVLARFGRMADQAALAEVSTAAVTAATSTPGTPAPETAPLGTPPLGMPGTEATGTGMSGSGGAGRDEPVRDQLFSLLMRRIDVLAAHRAGVLALLRAAPADPALALWLGCATRRSMRWMLEAAGVSTSRAARRTPREGPGRGVALDPAGLAGGRERGSCPHHGGARQRAETSGANGRLAGRRDCTH